MKRHRTPKPGPPPSAPNLREGKYRVAVMCGNCGDDNRLEIQRGQMIEHTECPTCGCKELRRATMATGYRI